MKSFRTKTSLAVGLMIAVMVLFSQPLFAGGTQGAVEESPTLYWFTSV